ncbi:MAG TPA: 2-oxoglutarate dehydrogenase E1 component [Ktedonobacteraceae bacterium]|nr:2-oxoglutarate dehydrogenase E1 component [Ktedonobacteraceae bacterium]
MYNLETFYGPNAGYVLELYDRYRQDPQSVDAVTRAIFEKWSPNGPSAIALPALAGTDGTSGAIAPSLPQVDNIVAASALAHAIRSRGHLGAHLDPLGAEPLGDPALLPETYALTTEDLAQLPPTVVGGHSAEGVSNALEAVAALNAMYSGTISYEFDQVKSPVERGWLRDAVGLRLYEQRPSSNASRSLLKRLTQVETFERYLHQTYPGQKRFSIEGTDMMVPMLDELIQGAIESGTSEVIIGMAHRGRLNVLAHVLGKSYVAILAEFAHQKHEEGVPLTDSFGFGWTGDVKYHLGAENILGEDALVNLKVVLAPNPSHLEFVNPVIEGMARASQDVRDMPGAPQQDVDCSLPVLIHGDAAFPGEGVVAETLNLWHLKGYWVGGTIHIIANNQLGFTTEPEDSRSTHFASDLAKGFEIPIIHVNADDPEACLTAVRLAQAYRDQFHKDVLIDLVGYRRWGHNEGDEPAFTQPQMYEVVRTHPSVREIYAQKLEQQGIISAEEATEILKEAHAVLAQAKREADGGQYVEEQEKPNGQNEHVDEAEKAPAISDDQLRQFNNEMLQWPAGFTPNPKLTRLLQRRATTLGSEGGIDWGQAEALAFAAILSDGTPIRITGQDTERGTFSHRHAVLHDQQLGEIYIPLQHLAEAKASFAIYNSPLSEAAALGFEYGYSVHAPDALVLWEAQFGDFANAGQVIIDQFISSARAKWRQQSGLVLLLPHGYEGQGPEHSSARLERYLQLAAQNNWRVANCSTSAQYFHLLRQQAMYLQHDSRPLVVMTPKSLLRNPLSAAKLTDLTDKTFQAVLDDEVALQHASAIRRVILCTGKMAIDLLANEKRAQADDLAIVRVEMLYPFPANALKKVIANYPFVQEVIWVQEEPGNMGAWSYMAPHLTSLLGSKTGISVIARPDRASPAAGFWDLYIAEQEEIMRQAFGISGITMKERGEHYVR